MDEIGVVHGRFQVLHNDHLAYILAGKARCSRLIVGITNPDPTLTAEDPSDLQRSRPSENPLTYFERYAMVREVLLEAGVLYENFFIVPLPVNFPHLYGYYLPLDAVFYLTIYDQWGRRKLDRFRKRGLKTEVLWERPPSVKGLRAGMIRRRMARGEPWEQLVPPAVARLMREWGIPERLSRIYEAG